MAILFQTLGADPEVFLVNKNGHPVSAEGRIGGTKENPKPMEGLPPGFNVQEDNVAAEYNIPPCMTAEAFSKSVNLGLTYIRKLVSQQGLRPLCVSALHFPKAQLATPHAQRLGCDPDLDFWKLRYNETPVPPETLRTAAGHIHIGWVEPNDDQRVALARALDLFLAVPSILVTEKTERRGLYGKAGAVRVKDYGLEYRTLDNFWIEKSKYRLHVFQTVRHVVEKLNQEKDFLAEEIDLMGDDIQECINNHNTELAKELMREFDINPWPSIVSNNIEMEKPKMIMETARGGKILFGA